MKVTRYDIESAVYGHAIGDAVGVPYEFAAREKRVLNPCVGMVGGGTFNKPAGTWSDDTSMTLATMDGLTTFNGDYAVIMENFVAWLKEGKYTTDGVFDVGRTCLKAIYRFEEGINPVECGGRKESENGNGSLMRILSATLYSLAKYGGIDYKFIGDISSLTHGHEISKTACIIYSEIVKLILEKNISRESIVKAISVADRFNLSVFNRIKTVAFFDLPESKIKSTGYVVDTLEAALWCFANTTNYKDCVLKAVNLGGDTDTIAAVAGGLAGLKYGKINMPNEWITALRGKETIDAIIDNFAKSVMM